MSPKHTAWKQPQHEKSDGDGKALCQLEMWEPYGGYEAADHQIAGLIGLDRMGTGKQSTPNRPARAMCPTMKCARFGRRTCSAFSPSTRRCFHAPGKRNDPLVMFPDEPTT